MMLKKATMMDFEDFFLMKSEEDNMFWCGYNRKPIKETLLAFWNKHILGNTFRTIYIIEWENKKVRHHQNV